MVVHIEMADAGETFVRAGEYTGGWLPACKYAARNA
jgi:hypothetical protein